MISPKLVEETKQSNLFKELCEKLKDGVNPSSLILIAIVYGIDLGRSQQSFPLPPILDEDEKFVLEEATSDKAFFEKGLNDLFEYMPGMRDHISLGTLVHSLDVVSLVAKQLVVFFKIQQRAAERKQVEDLEYLVRG